MDVPRTPTRRRGPIAWIASGGVALLLATFGLSRLSSAPPSVDRSLVWIDSVKRGTLIRQVSGPGTLVPEEIRWVTATTAGRVERILVEPGAAVEADSVLVELSNPDLQLQLLEARREQDTARADFANLRATLEIQRLDHESVLAGIQMAYREAERQRAAAESMAEQDMIGALELARVQERAEELGSRLVIEKRHAVVLAEAAQARLAANQSQVDRMRALFEFRREQRDALHVRAGLDGVLQELPLEVGQQLAPGALLAKVVQPERLKAALRIPEAQAKEVRLGQRASVDTRIGVVEGRVVRIDPAVQRATVTVDVAFDEPLPEGARPDLSVDGRIELERIPDALYVGRPAYGKAESRVTLFVLEEGDESAMRRPVVLGRGSVSEIEILEGLEEGDRVILSDMSEWDAVERIALD